MKFIEKNVNSSTSAGRRFNLLALLVLNINVLNLLLPSLSWQQE